MQTNIKDESHAVMDTANIENNTGHLNQTGVPVVDAHAVEIGLMKSPGNEEKIEPLIHEDAPAKFWTSFVAEPLKGIGASIRRGPHIIVLPLILLGLMVGLGVWGVMAASSDSANNKKNDATAAAIEVASGFEVCERGILPLNIGS